MGEALAIGIPSIKAAEKLDEALVCLTRQTIKPYLMVVANGERVYGVCDKWQDRIHCYKPAENIGVAASWNLIADWAFGFTEHLIISNDDIRILNEDALYNMQQALIKKPLTLFMVKGFSFFGLSKQLYKLVGSFDEGFWPAYYEDNDYYHRTLLKGGNIENLDHLVDSIHDTSTTIRDYPDMRAINDRTFELNKQRYLRKWGGEPIKELYKEPWNGQAAEASTKDIYKGVSGLSF